MIKEYQLEEWNGGKVRHIVRDKIILLERGQVFNIDDKTFFTFGGASSHDIILQIYPSININKSSKAYLGIVKRTTAFKAGIMLK